MRSFSLHNCQSPVQDRDFVSCMRDELIGMIPGMELVDLMRGDIISYIQGKMWGKAASYIPIFDSFSKSKSP